MRVRPLSIGLAVAVAGGIGLTAWHFHGGGQTAQGAPPTATAKRGDLVVTVGGVGRVVVAGPTAQIAVPSSSTSGGGSSTTGSSGSSGSGGGGGAGTTSMVPADAVFPRAGGHVSRFLVAPGQRVSAGQPLALLDDSGSAAAAVGQAESDVATAQLELLQKRTSDPLKGIPATPAELASGRYAEVSAQAKLAQLLGPPRRADVSTARLDLKRAEADLESLQGGTPAARARAIRVAQAAVDASQKRLDKLLAPPDPADVSAAEFEVKKAEADLADLQRADPPASAEALAAARKAVDAARLKLAKVLQPASAADVATARSELDKAQAELETLQAGPSPAGIAAAQQAVTAARMRLRQLLGPPLRSDVTAVRLDLRKAQADLAVLHARGGPGSTIDVDIARLKLEAANAKLAVARFAAQQLTVRAPAAGTVTGLLTVTGAPVDPSTPLATVADLDHLAASVDLSEFDAAQVKRGLGAVVRVDALGGRSIPGRVLFEALAGVDSGGVVTFPVRVGFNRVAGVKPGMNVSVRIIVAKRPNVVRVPLEAVSEDDSGHSIVTVAGPAGQSSTRRVKLGLSNNKDVEIKRGLRPGERVVLAGAQSA